MANRIFNYSDEALTMYASEQLSFLQEDLPDFTAFDPDLGEEKRNRMSELVDWALNEGGDDLNVAKLGTYTEQLLNEMEEAKRLYNQLRYWVLKTFPTQKAVQRQFGIGRFKKIVNSQESMVVFLNSLVSSVDEYRTELEGANAPADLLDSVSTQAKALQEANNAQEKKKGNRTVETEERVEKLNELHKYTKDYNTAAEFVYYDFPAKRDRYRPPSKTNAVDEEDANSSETLTDGAFPPA